MLAGTSDSVSRFAGPSEQKSLSASALTGASASSSPVSPRRTAQLPVCDSASIMAACAGCNVAYLVKQDQAQVGQSSRFTPADGVRGCLGEVFVVVERAGALAETAVQVDDLGLKSGLRREPFEGGVGCVAKLAERAFQALVRRGVIAELSQRTGRGFGHGPDGGALDDRRQRRAAPGGERGSAEKLRKPWHRQEPDVGKAGASQLVPESQVDVVGRPDDRRGREGVVFLQGRDQIPQTARLSGGVAV